MLKVYENTSPTQEVAHDQDILFLNVGDRFNTSAYNIVKLKDKPFVEGLDPSQPFFGGGFKEGYAPEIKDKENPVSSILAIDPKPGRQLWAIRDIANYTAGVSDVRYGGGCARGQSPSDAGCGARTGEPPKVAGPL